MLKQVLAASIVAAFSIATAAFAQDKPVGQPGAPGARGDAQIRADFPRCDPLQGAEKERCIREERAKVGAGGRVEQSKPENDPVKRDASKGTGGTPPQ